MFLYKYSCCDFSCKSSFLSKPAFQLIEKRGRNKEQKKTRYKKKKNPDSLMAFNSNDFKISGPRYLNKLAIDWSNTHHRTTIASSLVQGVYVMEEDRKQERQGVQALAPPWWDSFNFQLVSDCRDKSDFSIYGAMYEFKYPISTFSEPQLPPQYVIAFRGTVIKRGTVLQDLNRNIDILVKQNLENSSRVEQAMMYVKESVDDVGAENVWLAGHSLGSAIALTVGRNMVKMGFLLETYLFNPPFITVPLPRIKNDKLKFGARVLGAAAKAGLSRVFMNSRQRAQGEDTFIQLSGWAPYLCVNRADAVCSEYIGYFENRQKMERSGGLVAKMGKVATQYSTRSIAMLGMGRSAEPFHLLPSAHLVINMNVSQGFREAHGVAQWWTESFNFQHELYKY